MAMAQRIDSDAGGKVEIAFAVRRGQPGTLAFFEGDVNPAVVRHQGGHLGSSPHYDRRISADFRVPGKPWTIIKPVA